MSALPPPFILSEPPPDMDFVEENIPPDDDGYGDDYDISEEIEEPSLIPSPPPLDLSKPLDTDDNLSLNIENQDDFEFSTFNSYNSCQSFEPNNTPIDVKNCFADTQPPNLNTTDIPANTVLSLANESTFISLNNNSKSTSDNSQSDDNQSFDKEEMSEEIDCKTPPSLELETNALDLEKVTVTDCNTSLEIENEALVENKMADLNKNDEAVEFKTVILDEILAEEVDTDTDDIDQSATMDENVLELNESPPPDLLDNLPDPDAEEECKIEPISEQNNNKIIESANTVPPVVETVETESDDEFDDFTDFKTAPTVATSFGEVVATVNEVAFSDFGDFQADFSQFESAFTPELETTQAPGSPEKSERSTTSAPRPVAIEDDDEEDDDFGDFNDFQQSSAIVEEPKEEVAAYQPLAAPMLTENFKSTIDVMFPKVDENQSAENMSSTLRMEDMKDNNLILMNLVDFDLSKALSYQYANSKSSQSLLKALCIDTRNILYGVKWKSNMPRFAADLSSHPLQPIKSTTPANHHPPSMAVMKPQVQSSNSKLAANFKATTALSASVGAEVPAVHFDWNSAGLVNPLDGVQEIINEETKQQKSDQLENVVLDNHTTTTAETATTKQPEKDNKVELPPLPSIPKSGVDHPDDRYMNPHQTTTTYDANRSIVRTIKLPETHIFTPIKSLSAISQEVTNRDIDFGNFVSTNNATVLQTTTTVTCDDVIKEIDNKIVVKEYHDVEYNLDSPKAMKMDILQAEKIENGTNITINWPEPGNVEQKVNVDDIFGDFLTAKDPVMAELGNTIPITVSPIHEANIRTEKPIFGISPTEEKKSAVEEDEFSDFQAAEIPAKPRLMAPQCVEPIPNLSQGVFPSYDSWLQSSQTNTPTHIPNEVVPQQNHSVVTNQILLLPTKLERSQVSNASVLSSEVLGDSMGWSDQLSKQAAAKINWPEPGVDADELARFEAAFPKNSAPQLATNNNNKKEEDDEWNDFVSHTNVSSHKSQKVQQKSTTAVDDEWSDFVSAAITAAPVSSQYNQQFSSNRPSFPAWNQPPAPMSYHHSSKNPMHREQYDFTNQYQQHSYPHQQQQHQQSQIKDTVPTIAYNIGDYNFMNRNYQTSSQQQRPTSTTHMSTMPELDFIAPKKLISSFAGKGGGGFPPPGTKK